MSKDGVRRMYFTGDPKDPEATERWAEEVIETLEEISRGPLPHLPGLGSPFNRSSHKMWGWFAKSARH